MKIYIAGKITGDDNYREKFAIAEHHLINKGHQVMNPARLNTGMSSSGEGLWYYKDAWNRHMAKRQEQAAGKITEKKGEPTNDTYRH